MKPLTQERLDELKNWLTPDGQQKIKFVGDLKAEFLQAVAEMLHLLMHGWLPPVPRARCGDFALVRNGAEPPYLATISNPHVELLWQERSEKAAAKYVERVEVTYYTKNEEELKKEKGDGPANTKRAALRNIVPALRKKVPRAHVSDFC